MLVDLAQRFKNPSQWKQVLYLPLISSVFVNTKIGGFCNLTTQKVVSKFSEFGIKIILIRKSPQTDTHS